MDSADSAVGNGSGSLLQYPGADILRGLCWDAFPDWVLLQYPGAGYPKADHLEEVMVRGGLWCLGKASQASQIVPVIVYKFKNKQVNKQTNKEEVV